MWHMWRDYIQDEEEKNEICGKSHAKKDALRKVCLSILRTMPNVNFSTAPRASYERLVSCFNTPIINLLILVLFLDYNNFFRRKFLPNILQNTQLPKIKINRKKSKLMKMTLTDVD